MRSCIFLGGYIGSAKYYSYNNVTDLNNLFPNDSNVLVKIALATDTCLNAPTNSYYYVVQFSIIAQIAFSYWGNEGCYFRSFNNGAWTAWTKL